MQDTLTRLKQRIKNNDELIQGDQDTLLKLIEELEAEAQELEAESSEKIRRAIDATEAACNTEKDEGPLESLQSAMQEIEASHPKTAETLARIGNILGRMGI